MTDIKRRKFVTFLSAGAAAVPLSALITALPSHAADALVDPESAQAKGLEYKVTSEIAGKNCASCALYSGAEGEEMGGCPLFAGNSVGAEAWCKAYVPKG